jgi:hypothetical protein
LQFLLNGVAGVSAWDGFWGRKIVLRDGFLLLYCAAVGFVASGVAASFYKMMTTETPRFTLLGKGIGALVVTFVFCGVTGPAIVMDMVLKSRVTDRGAIGTAMFGVFVALLWSVCSGILVLDVVINLRDSFA